MKLYIRSALGPEGMDLGENVILYIQKHLKGKHPERTNEREVYLERQVNEKTRRRKDVPDETTSFSKEVMWRIDDKSPSIAERLTSIVTNYQTALFIEAFYGRDSIEGALNGYSHLEPYSNKSQKPEFRSAFKGAFYELLDIAFKDIRKAEVYGWMFSSRFGPHSSKVLQEYGLEEALEIQQSLDEEGLYLPKVMSAGTFVIDKKSNWLYLIGKEAEMVLSEEGLQPQQLFSSKQGDIFKYQLSLNKGVISLVPQTEEKPMELFTNIGNLLWGLYRNGPLGSSHAFEHAMSKG